MVCMDGFVLTHAFERVDVADQERSTSSWTFGRAGCSTRPHRSTIGAMVGPEAFTEVRYLAHRKQCGAALIPRWSPGVRAPRSGAAGGLVRPYRCEDAETVVVALGSVLGTLKDTVDALRAPASHRRTRPHRVPSVPAGRGRRALAGASGVVVLERAFRSASAGSSRRTCAAARRRRPVHRRGRPRRRPVTRASLRRLLDAVAGRLGAADLPGSRQRGGRARAAPGQERAGRARPRRTCCGTWGRADR